MGTVLKIFAVLVVIGGLWVWIVGRSVTSEVVDSQSLNLNLSAATVRAPVSEHTAFDKEGAIILDQTQGQNGTPYILFTTYSEDGAPSVQTKRLVFENRDVCAELSLPCATNQPSIPVSAGDRVRIIGEQKDEYVIVREVYRI